MEEDSRGQHHSGISEVKASWWEAQQLQAYLRDKAECVEHDQEEEEEGKVDEGEHFDGSEEESTDNSQSIPSTEEDNLMSPTSHAPPSSQCETVSHTNTPSTASFITAHGSSSSSCSHGADERDTDTSLMQKLHLASPTCFNPAIAMETTPILPAIGGGRGSFDDINPELPPKRPLLVQEQEQEEAEANEGMQKHHRGAQSLPPLHAVGEVLLLQLKGLKDAPLLGQLEAEGSGARALLRSALCGNVNKSRRGSASLPCGERQKKQTTNHGRLTDYRRGTLSEESELGSSTLLKRCSLTPRKNLQLELFELTSEIQQVTIKEEVEKMQDSDGGSSCPTEVVGVLNQPKEPSSISVKETLFQKKTENEDEALDAKITRRVQRAARRQAKQEQLKRLHKAQVIQRQLQQVEEKQRQLEARGVVVEKALRGEADYWGESGDSQEIDLHLGGLSKLESPALMQQWFQLVQQKNALVRYESELIIFARELELEDRQSRLQQELRERMAVDDHLKEASELAEERLILEEMLEVVEQRDALVALLEEQRLQERQEDNDLEAVMLSRGLGLHWA